MEVPLKRVPFNIEMEVPLKRVPFNIEMEVPLIIFLIPLERFSPTKEKL
jgi:hypothetical protein